MLELSQALKSKQSLSVAECESLLSKARERFAKVKGRRDEMRRGGRARLLTSGTPDDVRAFDKELDSVTIESEQLRAQMNALMNARQAAIAREASEGMAGHYAELNARLKALEEAQAQLANAWREADKAHQKAAQARIAAIRGGFDPEPASGDLVLRAANARNGGVNVNCRLGNMSAHAIHEELAEQLQTVSA